MINRLELDWHRQDGVQRGGSDGEGLPEAGWGVYWKEARIGKEEP